MLEGKIFTILNISNLKVEDNSFLDETIVIFRKLISGILICSHSQELLKEVL